LSIDFIVCVSARTSWGQSGIGWTHCITLCDTSTPKVYWFWDVSHQTYGHKMPDWTWEKFDTKQTIGISQSFLNEKWSEYDTGVATPYPISAALGWRCLKFKWWSTSNILYCSNRHDKLWLQECIEGLKPCRSYWCGTGR
jgi:hypothetical protein